MIKIEVYGSRYWTRHLQCADIFTTIIKQTGRDVYVKIRVMFKVSVKGQHTEYDFDDWAESQAGQYCVLLEPLTADWEPVEDFAGEVYLGTKNEYGHSFSDLYPV
jgi:hypothetical protein